MFTLKAVSKFFVQGNQRVSLFEDSSCQFLEGVSYAIMGPSGSGKSTLLHMLMGIEASTSGSIFLGKKNITTMSAAEKDVMRASLGVMFQQPYLVSELTVLENVMLKASLHGSVSEVYRKRAHKLLASVGLAGKEDMMPLLLSGGEQQRVALLRALFHPPKWLLVDEPTGSLDEKSGQEILLLLKQYQSIYNMGIIMSTHDAKIAQSMDHVICIKDKKLEKSTE
jgi:ABC-type lipoprotein export system ATPase subunit